MKKIKTQSGETLVEVLVSVLVITFVFLILTNSMTNAARITKQAKDMDSGFSYTENSPTDATISIVFSDTDIEGTSKEVNLYQSETGEYYYQAKGKE